MSSLRECPSCRALLTAEQRSSTRLSCPYCGRPIDDLLDPDNPYAPPRSTSDEPLAPSSVPRDLGGKVMLAANLFIGLLPLFSALVLTVWLPGNILIELIDATNPNPNAANSMAIYQLRNLVEAVFGPIYVGGILTALAARMSGSRISYFEGLRAGLHHWGRLFWTHLVTGLIIGLGFLALIIPGVIFAIRYCLVDEIVVIEGEGATVSRARSTYLTRDRRGQILVGGCLYLVSILSMSFLLGAILEKVDPSILPFVSAAGLCVIDILVVYFTCFFFVMYWEARQDELEREADSRPLISSEYQDL
jgi:hypothetical protein